MKRLYSLYEKQDGKWVRIGSYSYEKSKAVRVYQNALINGFFSGKRVELRPTGEKIQSDSRWDAMEASMG